MMPSREERAPRSEALFHDDDRAARGFGLSPSLRPGAWHLCVPNRTSVDVQTGQRGIGDARTPRSRSGMPRGAPLAV
jgi:hypothetical protein